MAQRELDDLKEKGTQVILGVSTIASTPPATPREEYVYNISKLLLEQSYTHTRGQGEHFTLPDKRCLADMLNEVSISSLHLQVARKGLKVSDVSVKQPVYGNRSEEMRLGSP